MSEFTQCYLITCVTMVTILALVLKKVIVGKGSVTAKKTNDAELEVSADLDFDLEENNENKEKKVN